MEAEADEPERVDVWVLVNKEIQWCEWVPVPVRSTKTYSVYLPEKNNRLIPIRLRRKQRKINAKHTTPVYTIIRE